MAASISSSSTSSTSATSTSTSRTSIRTHISHNVGSLIAWMNQGHSLLSNHGESRSDRCFYARKSNKQLVVSPKGQCAWIRVETTMEDALSQIRERLCRASRYRIDSDVSRFRTVKPRTRNGVSILKRTKPKVRTDHTNLDTVTVVRVMGINFEFPIRSHLDLDATPHQLPHKNTHRHSTDSLFDDCPVLSLTRCDEVHSK